MPNTREICPHAWGTTPTDVTRSVNEAGKTVTHTFTVYTCQITGCGQTLERENEINT